MELMFAFHTVTLIFSLNCLLYLADGLPTEAYNTTAAVALCDADYEPCLDGSGCYSKESRCDKFPDCADSSDEEKCETSYSVTCDKDEFYCASDNSCFPNSYRCDNQDDCLDGSDEEGCIAQNCTAGHEFMCLSDHRCINIILVCDGIFHCHDSSDELNCQEHKHECHLQSEIDCLGNGTECVSINVRCNGHNDCSNGIDEAPHVCNTSHSNSTISAGVGCSHNNGGCADLCVPKQFGYYCDCHQGFEIGTDHLSCDDVNECSNGSVCSQLCDNLYGTYKCSCTEGYVLSADLHTCVVANGLSPELWIASNTSLTQYNVRAGSQQQLTFNGVLGAVEFDYTRHKIFWTDLLHSSINWMNVNGTDIEELVTRNVDSPSCVAYDWIHKNLYWGDSAVHSHHHRATINVMAIDTRWRRVLHNGTVVSNPVVMVVDPREDERFLYWAQSGKTPGIFRCGLDGTNHELVEDHNVEHPSGMTLDFVSDMLLWIDGRLLTLESWHIKTDVRRVLYTITEYPRHPAGLAIIEDWIYWTDEMTHSLYKMNKRVERDHFTEAHSVLNVSSPHGILVFHRVKQPLDKNYCELENGGCSHLCLPSDTFAKYTCLCPDDEKFIRYTMGADGKTCIVTSVSVAHSRPLSQQPEFAVTSSLNSRTNGAKTTRSLSNDILKPTLAAATSTVSLDSTVTVQHDDIWLPVIVGIVVLLACILVLLFIGYKIFRNLRKRTMQFDNPIFIRDKESQQALSPSADVHQDQLETVA